MLHCNKNLCHCQDSTHFLHEVTNTCNTLPVQDRTPLHDALLRGHTGIAAILLSKGADIHAKDAQVTSAFE